MLFSPLPLGGWIGPAAQGAKHQTGPQGKGKGRANGASPLHGGIMRFLSIAPQRFTRTEKTRPPPRSLPESRPISGLLPVLGQGKGGDRYGLLFPHSPGANTPGIATLQRGLPGDVPTTGPGAKGPEPGWSLAVPGGGTASFPLRLGTHSPAWHRADYSAARIPATQAVVKEARVPETTAQRLRRAISARRSGARADRPPMRIPILPKLAKPQRA